MIPPQTPQGEPTARGPGLWALALVVAIAVASVAVRHRLEAERWSRNDRHHLPGFDAYVYVAMAESPTLFTVAPWGYRVLSPWLARAIDPRDVVDGFRWLALIALSAAGPLLYSWLRLRGHAAPHACLAAAALYWTPPVDAAFFNYFLAEPVGIVLLLLLLIALERRSLGGAALCLALGALTKDVFLLLLPGVAAVLVSQLGFRRGGRLAVLAALPALAAAVSLRVAWPPPPEPDAARITPEAALAALRMILAAAGEWWAPLFACGFPLALVGVLRPRGRALLRSHGLLLATALALPFAAAVYTGDAFPARQLYVGDVPRLLAYALPVLLSLALVALAPVPAPAPVPGRLPRRLARGLRVAAWSGAALAAAVPALALDRYRREDLRGRNDGHLVLAFCSQSQAFARRLSRGRLVAYEPEARRYRRGDSDPVHMERMRWFLREGWGPGPHHGMGRVVMQARTATLIVPCFEPADIRLAIRLRAPRRLDVGLEMNGTPLGRILVGPGAPRRRIEVPASSLFRGDNRLRLVAPEPGVRLELLNLRLADP